MRPGVILSHITAYAFVRAIPQVNEEWWFSATWSCVTIQPTDSKFWRHRLRPPHVKINAAHKLPWTRVQTVGMQVCKENLRQGRWRGRQDPAGSQTDKNTWSFRLCWHTAESNFLLSHTHQYLQQNKQQQRVYGWPAVSHYKHIDSINTRDIMTTTSFQKSHGSSDQWEHRQVAADPQTKPTKLRREYAVRLLSSTHQSTIVI